MTWISPTSEVAGFRTVDCGFCGTGMLKPDVVFFGETVPAAAGGALLRDLVERARSLLVLGSSLTVMSGRRFVIRAAKRGMPVAIVNQGATRGDGYAAVRVDAPLRRAAAGAGRPARRRVPGPGGGGRRVRRVGGVGRGLSRPPRPVIHGRGDDIRRRRRRW